MKTPPGWAERLVRGSKDETGRSRRGRRFFTGTTTYGIFANVVVAIHILDVRLLGLHVQVHHVLRQIPAAASAAFIYVYFQGVSIF